MSNVINLPPNTKDGLYRGEPHNDPNTGEPRGGIKVVIDGIKPVEVEDREYHICREAMESDEVYEFRQKTNREVLDKLFRGQGCVFEQGKSKSMDFIVCKVVVEDQKRYDRKGKIKEIINQMQAEKSCRMTSDAEWAKQMGLLLDGGTLEAEAETLTAESTQPDDEYGYSAGLAVIYQDSILLTHPTNSKWHGTYSIPKGKMEEDEAFLESAVREAVEETGIGLRGKHIEELKKQTPVILHYVKKKGVQTKMAYFILRIDSLEEIGLDDTRVPKEQLQLEEVDWAGFVKFDEAHKRMHPLQTQIIDALEGTVQEAGDKAAGLDKEIFADAEVKTIEGKRTIPNLYHGTCKKFERFDLKKIGKPNDLLSNFGFHFTPDKRVATNLFAHTQIDKDLKNCRVYKVNIDVKKTLKITESDLVLSALRYGIKTKFFVNEDGKEVEIDMEKIEKMPYFSSDSSQQSIVDVMGYHLEPRFDVQKLAKDFLKNVLIKNGYDSIYYMNEIEWAHDKRWDWIVFSEKQIEVEDEEMMRDEQMEIGGLFHGTPQEIKGNKFKLSKVGKGEGSTAFGWGIYLTSEKDVAKFYGEMGSQENIFIDGKRLADIDAPKEVKHLIVAEYNNARNRVKDGNVEDSIDEMWTWIDANAMLVENDGTFSEKELAELNKVNQKYIDAKKLIEGKTFEVKPNIYEVTLFEGLPEGKYDFLRWDKAVPQAQINKIVEQLKKENKYDAEANFVFQLERGWFGGERLYNSLSDYLTKEGYIKEASLFLLRAGINGIKYPCGSHTYAPYQIPEGECYNYVVFDESAPTIKGKMMEAGGEAQLELFQQSGKVIDEVVEKLQAKYIDRMEEITDLPVGTEEEKKAQRQAVIDWVTNPANNVKVVIAFSGGKDSVAMVLYALFVLKIPKERIELWHHDVDGHGEQLYDWACTPSYCEEFAKAFGLKLLFSYAQGGILREIYRQNETVQPIFYQQEPSGDYIKVEPRGLPADNNTRMKFPAVSADLMTRWCSWIAKISVMNKAINNWSKYKNANICIMTGERRQESTARSGYKEVEKYRSATLTRRAIQWRPIIDWSEKEVWAIMEQHRVQPHPCYELGWGRCSCQLCIFSSPNTWASIQEISPEKVQRIGEIEKDINFTLYAKSKTVKGKKEVIMEDIYSARVNKGKSFVTPEAKERWMKEALGTFTSPIIVENWKLPAGAFNGETSGAN